MRKLLLSVSYDGSDYHGWQRQAHARTVQQTLEEALGKLLGAETSIVGCSRTDTGVHAYDQKAVFRTDVPIPADKFPIALKTYLTDDIIIMDCREVADDFHPRYEAAGKLYSYTINTGPQIDFRRRRYSWHLPSDLDEAAMCQAAEYLTGKHDFAAFCAAGSQVESTVRVIYSITMERDHDGYLVIRYHGGGFLYKMVRILTATLVDIGLGKFPPEHALRALREGDRRLASRTAPPGGLCLEKVYFNTENQ